MSFSGAIRACLRRYATFSGRASRSEYWFFVLFLLLGGVVAGLFDGLLFGAATVEAGPGRVSAQSGGPITAVFALATAVPLVAAGWRRMHDSGRSGLHLFYPVIVIVGISGFFGTVFGFDPFADGALPEGDGLMSVLFAGSLIVLFLSPLIVVFWLTRPSQPGANRYGPNPHEVTP